ncbi:unnamed protein product [Urochloa humidicola]
MAASKLALKALALLFVLCSHQLVQAQLLKRASGHGPIETKGASPTSAMMPTPASVEATAGESDEKAVLPLLIMFITKYIASHFLAHFVPRTCIPVIAKHCGWKVSVQCIKDARSKCTKQEG